MAGLLFRMNNHLGDSPGVFNNANYVGLNFELPFTVTWVEEKANSVALIIDTSDIETWGDWRGHPVFLNDIEIGRINDPTNAGGNVETTRLTIQVRDHLDAIKVGAKNRLTISVEKKDSHPGLLDDFILLSYSLEGFAGSVGW